MKKIFFVFCFCVSVFNALSFAQTKNNENSLSVLVQTYVDLNSKLKQVKQDSAIEATASKEIIEEISREKNIILNKIPHIIVEQKIDEDAVDEFLKAQESLESLQKQYENNRNQNFAFIDTTLDLTRLDMVKVFYSALFRLEKLFLNVSSSNEMIALLDEAIEKLTQYGKLNLDEKKSQIQNESELNKIAQKEATLENALTSYSEILRFLRGNASLFESNYLFSSLKLQVGIDEINKVVAIESLNVGKIVISLLVIAFFVSLRKFSSHILYFFLIRLVYRNKDTDYIKKMFIEHIKKPVGWLLLTYGLNVCVNIVYYPAPISLGIANLFYIIYALFIVWAVFVLLDSYGILFVSKIAQKSGKKEIVNVVVKILYFVVLTIALLFVLARLGFNISALITSLGIGGAAMALAAKDIIANFFASVMLLFDDSFNQGDWVEVLGVEGTIVETGLRKTTIRTFDNSLVFLQNSAIMSANIKNWSKRKVGRHIKMYLGVEYNATPQQLESCLKDLRECLETSPLVAHEGDCALNACDITTKYRQNLVSMNDLEGYKNACYVNLSDFADSSINIELYFYTKAVTSKDFRATKSALMLEFMKIIEKNGLNFAFPSKSVYIEKLPELKISGEKEGNTQERSD
ncbi:MAG: mechanosensitive ion channel family protein [Helicobacter sp.]|uniref:mechanosensitive ion channel family protein n=1 Tax=Helicobacter sp. TaxID=218 RepID=UPI0023CC45E1|nr:mechanosensitive ion channel family protein [Helicobacter sp.]MDE5925508.1 mechanosensitive ion channel family protein [Helicobacter sp.]MDE7175420.1 mechanosensitive ion channel family protein [Helicobacter sp.]